MKTKNTDTKTPPKPMISLSRQAVLGWASGFAVLLVLFFFLGTLVGRNMIQVDLGQDGLYFEIAGLTEAENQNDLSEMASMPDTPQDFDFFDALRKDVDAAPAEIIQPKSVEPKKKQVVKTNKKVVKPEKVAQAPEAPPPAAKPEPVAAKTKTEAMTDPLNLDPNKFKYTIQAASFKQPDEADKLVATLKQKGYPAYWVKGVVREDEVWFRVRVGAFQDRMSAQSTLDRLKQDRIDAFFVKRETHENNSRRNSECGRTGPSYT